MVGFGIGLGPFLSLLLPLFPAEEEMMIYDLYPSACFFFFFFLGYIINFDFFFISWVLDGVGYPIN